MQQMCQLIFMSLCTISITGSSLYDYQSSELSPIHLRKAKLMFLWTRYPDSKVIEHNFPDIRFDKKTKAQVVKWFSNFR